MLDLEQVSDRGLDLLWKNALVSGRGMVGVGPTRRRHVCGIWKVKEEY